MDREYVIMFSDGTLYVNCLLVLVFMADAGMEFEELGVL